MGPYAERKRCACPGDLNPCMRRSRWRVGWWEFSARLLGIAVLPVLNTGQHFPFRRAIAPELIRNDDPWHVA